MKKLAGFADADFILFQGKERKDAGESPCSFRSLEVQRFNPGHSNYRNIVSFMLFLPWGEKYVNRKSSGGYGARFNGSGIQETWCPTDRRRGESTEAEFLQEGRKGRGRVGGYDFGHRGPCFQRNPRAFGIVHFFLTLARWSSYTLHMRIFKNNTDTTRPLGL